MTGSFEYKLRIGEKKWDAFLGVAKAYGWEGKIEYEKRGIFTVVRAATRMPQSLETALGKGVVLSYPSVEALQPRAEDAKAAACRILRGEPLARMLYKEPENAVILGEDCTSYVGDDTPVISADIWRKEAGEKMVTALVGNCREGLIERLQWGLPEEGKIKERINLN